MQKQEYTKRLRILQITVKSTYSRDVGPIKQPKIDHSPTTENGMIASNRVDSEKCKLLRGDKTQIVFQKFMRKGARWCAGFDFLEECNDEIAAEERRRLTMTDRKGR